jgi:transposase
MANKQAVPSKMNRNGMNGATDPQVVPKGERRRFTAEYKLRILAEADGCTERGQVGALLRREGLYSSHLEKWRRQRARGALAALTPQKPGRKVDVQAAELTRLQEENERLQARLQQAETIIEVQKKLSSLLGLSVTGSSDGKSSPRSRS